MMTSQPSSDYSEPPKKVDLNSVDQSDQDALDLEAMGHEPALLRRFNIWSMLALAFSVLGTWSTFAQDLASGLENGGAVAILWGLCLVTFCNICIALSLGELLSAMPTALGQAYWIHRLDNTPSGRFFSYMCAWINMFGWWTLTASQMAFMTNFLGIKVMFDNNWSGASEGWVQLLVYLGMALAFTVVNIILCRRDKALPWFNNIVGIQFGTLFIVFCLAMVISVGVRENLHFQPANFVFGKWINQTSWPDGVVWFTGLIQAAYGLTAFDSVIHMIEEIPSPRTAGPKVIWLAVAIGAVTGGIFMIVCLFCIQSLDSVLKSPTGLPFPQLIIDTVGLQGAAALITLFCVNGLGQGVSIMTTASRLTWGFARDGGLPFSAYLTKVNEFWRVPVRVLWTQGFIIALIGILYLFATTVLEAILSVSTIALTISYAMPIVTLLLVGRDKLPPGQFALGRWGPLLNYVSVIYCIITTVFFFFPGSPDPSPSDTNYAIAVFGIMIVIALISWFVKGRKTYLETEDAKLAIFRAEQAERDNQPHIDGISTTKTRTEI
jgi:choline transport protein